MSNLLHTDGLGNLSRSNLKTIFQQNALSAQNDADFRRHLILLPLNSSPSPLVAHGLRKEKAKPQYHPTQ